MLEAYYQSATNLNLFSGFAKGGLDNLHELHLWNLVFLKKIELHKK